MSRLILDGSGVPIGVEERSLRRDLGGLGLLLLAGAVMVAAPASLLTSVLVAATMSLYSGLLMAVLIEGVQVVATRRVSWRRFRRITAVWTVAFVALAVLVGV